MFINDYPQHPITERVLKRIYRLAPFNIFGDLAVTKQAYQKDFLSCLICTARGPLVLKELLNDMAQQTHPRDRFEIILLDNSASGSKQAARAHALTIPLRYFRDTSNTGLIGSLRNQLLKHAKGEYILFLDDDTRMPQKDFLAKAVVLFNALNPDIILPKGEALPLKNNPGYRFLDPYSLATRCCLYKRAALDSLHGFRADMQAYEDIEFGIRASMTGARVIKTDQLSYSHPSLFFHSLKKPVAIGQSILGLRRHYPWHVWLMIYLNALRFLPLGMLPTMQNRQWFKISLGVLISPWTRQRATYSP